MCIWDGLLLSLSTLTFKTTVTQSALTVRREEKKKKAWWSAWTLFVTRSLCFAHAFAMAQHRCSIPRSLDGGHYAGAYVVRRWGRRTRIPQQVPSQTSSAHTSCKSASDLNGEPLAAPPPHRGSSCLYLPFRQTHSTGSASPLPPMLTGWPSLGRAPPSFDALLLESRAVCCGKRLFFFFFFFFFFKCHLNVTTPDKEWVGIDVQPSTESLPISGRLNEWNTTVDAPENVFFLGQKNLFFRPVSGVVNQPNFPIQFDSDYWSLDLITNRFSIINDYRFDFRLLTIIDLIINDYQFDFKLLGLSILFLIINDYQFDFRLSTIIDLLFNISQLLNYFTSLLSNTSQHLQYCIV